MESCILMIWDRGAAIQDIPVLTPYITWFPWYAVILYVLFTLNITFKITIFIFRP
jgi:hypothetical protein